MPEKLYRGQTAHFVSQLSRPGRPSASGNWKLAVPLLLLICPGCNVLGIVASKMPPPTIDPQYKGLANHSVAVMVWADRGIRIDWAGIRLDLANSIQSRLQPPADNPKKKPPAETTGTTFPVQPASIVRYQEDHPEIESMTITEIAPRFGVDRLIYVEVEDFATRAAGAVDLYRGSASASMKILEIDPLTKTAKIVYEEDGITAVFPPNSSPEGRPGIGDYKIYVGTVKALADEIVKRLLPWQEEP